MGQTEAVFRGIFRPVVERRRDPGLDRISFTEEIAFEEM